MLFLWLTYFSKFDPQGTQDVSPTAVMLQPPETSAGTVRRKRSRTSPASPVPGYGQMRPSTSAIIITLLSLDFFLSHCISYCFLQDSCWWVSWNQCPQRWWLFYNFSYSIKALCTLSPSCSASWYYSLVTFYAVLPLPHICFYLFHSPFLWSPLTVTLFAMLFLPLIRTGAARCCSHWYMQDAGWY